MQVRILAALALLALSPVALALPDVAVWTPAGETASAPCVPAWRDLAFASATSGFAVASCNAVLTSTDGGATWIAAAEPSQYGDVLGVDARGGLAVAVGENALKTPTAFSSVDGGATWRRASQYFRKLDPIDVVNHEGRLTDARVLPNGLVVLTGEVHTGEGVLARSFDGARSWSSGAWTPRAMRAVDFAPDGATGVAVGDLGSVWRTVDAGATWTSVAAPTARDLADVAFASATEAWIVGAGGAVLRSLDAGATWTPALPPTPFAFAAVEAPAPGVAYLAGDAPGVLATTDGGATWTMEPAAATARLDALVVAHGVAYAGGEGGLVARVAAIG